MNKEGIDSIYGEQKGAALDAGHLVPASGERRGLCKKRICKNPLEQTLSDGPDSRCAIAMERKRKIYLRVILDHLFPKEKGDV